MKDRQKIFIDKIVKLLVDDTRIDYDKGEITYPFMLHPTPYLSIYPSSHFFRLSSSLPSFYRYCKNSYGLTGNEIEYVWDQYRSVIKYKINNNER